MESTQGVYEEFFDKQLYVIIIFYFVCITTSFFGKRTIVMLLNNIMHMFCLLFLAMPRQRGLFMVGKISSLPPMPPPSGLFPSLLNKTSTWRLLCISWFYMCKSHDIWRSYVLRTLQGSRIVAMVLCHYKLWRFYYPKCSRFGCLNSTL